MRTRAERQEADTISLSTNQRIKRAADLLLTGAQQLLTAGLEIANQHGVRLAVAVVNHAGNLLIFARMDGAPIVTVEVAVGKTRTAALQGPVDAFLGMIDSGKPALATTPGLVPLQGGVSILLDGEVIGADGSSRSSGDKD